VPVTTSERRGAVNEEQLLDSVSSRPGDWLSDAEESKAATLKLETTSTGEAQFLAIGNGAGLWLAGSPTAPRPAR
jgi:hypothetical protein